MYIISSLNFHLFRSLQNSLNEHDFDSEETTERHLELCFIRKDVIFYERRILELPEKWQKIVDQNVKCIID